MRWLRYGRSHCIRKELWPTSYVVIQAVGRKTLNIPIENTTEHETFYRYPGTARLAFTLSYLQRLSTMFSSNFSPALRLTNCP